MPSALSQPPDHLPNQPSGRDILLAVDTATATASIALYDLANSTLLAESTWLARRRHTQELLLATQTLMAQLGVKPQRIAALAVTLGPGSFTGVRIAISVVKGIALGLAAPQQGTGPQAVGLPTVTVTAAPWLEAARGASVPLYAYIQAGRGRYNWAIFDSSHPGNSRASQGLFEPSAQDHHVGTAADFAAALAARPEQPAWLVGEAAPDLVQAVAALPHVTVMDSVSTLRRAGVLAHLASQRIAAGQVDDLGALQPLYLQTPA